jgi:hypothetical protein
MLRGHRLVTPATVRRWHRRLEPRSGPTPTAPVAHPTRRSDATKEIEILVLRRQLAVLRWRTPRPRMNWTDRRSSPPSADYYSRLDALGCSSPLRRSRAGTPSWVYRRIHGELASLGLPYRVLRGQPHDQCAENGGDDHHRGVVPAAPGLYFLGPPSQSSPTSAHVGGSATTPATSPNTPPAASTASTARPGCWCSPSTATMTCRTPSCAAPRR